jgi:hypothetical protein
VESGVWSQSNFYPAFLRKAGRGLGAEPPKRMLLI